MGTASCGSLTPTRLNPNHSIELIDLKALHSQEGFFCVISAGESAETRLGRDDAVARNDDSQRIAAHRLPHRSCRGGIVDRQRELSVCFERAERDSSQCIPNTLLKQCAGRLKRDVKNATFAAKVLVELRDGTFDQRGLSCERTMGAYFAEEDMSQRDITRDDCECACR